jgi:hypothetical protein
MPAMLRNLMRFGVTAVLLAAVAAPLRAAEPSDSEKLDMIYKRLRELQPKIELRLDNVEGDLKELRRRVEQLETRLRAPTTGDRIATEYTPPATDAELRDLRRRFDELDARLRACEATEKARIARSFTPSDTPTGTILLQNRTARSATIVVDGRPYALEPFQTAAIQSRPLGPVTYEVHAEGWGLIRPATTTRLASTDRPLTIWVGP